MKANQIIHGDCQKILTETQSESVDLIVTDPPYGYSFMGKDWDKAVPPVTVWEECLRVLKAGAFAFVMSSPRADVLSHMIVNLSDAGFRTDFTPIYWAYASGFPKAMNISLQIDKQECMKQLVTKLGREPIKDKERKIDEFADAWKVYRQVTGESKPIEYAGKFDQRSSQDRPKDSGAVSCEAKLLDGSYGGFQPKPAIEVIIVAMKPLSEKTFVDQALKNGKGVTWLDEARIPLEPYSYPNGCMGSHGSGEIYGKAKDDIRNEPYFSKDGRFPANLLVSDDILNDGTTYESHKGAGKFENKNSLFGFGGGNNTFGDEGSFSRYFSLDAWFEKTIKKLPVEVQRTFPFLIVPKASKAERNKNLDQCKTVIKPSHMRTANGTGKRSVETGFPDTKVKNFHPTVKPLKLMCYLVTLGSRTNDLVLDPFCGSGTTLLAAKLLGRRYIGIEIEKEYVVLAKARVESHKVLSEFEPKEAKD